MNKVVSIIVPVFNVEKYLPKCIESIINQTYKNLDIILVDDGSSDESPAICDKYAQEDPRISVIHKENGGVSSARNAALDVIRGDYVCFVDADDYINPEMVETLLNEAEKGYDMVQCSFVFLYADRAVSANISTRSEEYLGQTEILNAFFEGKIRNQLWNKVFAYNVIQGKKFDEDLKIAEDKLFVHDCLVDAKKVKCIPCELYFYIQRSNSAVNASFSGKFFDDVKVIDRLISKYAYSDDLKESLLLNASKVYLALFLRIVRTGDTFGIKDVYKDKVLSFKKTILKSDAFNTKEKLVTQMLGVMPKTAYVIIEWYLNRPTK